MKDDNAYLTLYVDDNPRSQEALDLLAEAGCPVCVKTAPSHYRAAYNIPVLFGLFNKFEGVEGVRIFLENSLAFQIGRHNGGGS